MDDRTFYFYAHPLRRRRFYLALVFATLLFPLIAFALIAGTLFLIVPWVALLIWISMRVFYARLIGNTVMVSDLNYPRIHAITEELKQRLGYEKRVYVFVYESASFNAFLSTLFFRRAIFLNSELLETGVSDDEIRWLVGRFVGYLRARRQAGPLGWVIRAAQYLLVFNFFLLPYERAMVFTGDRLAVAAIGGDISSAISALQKVFVGRQLGYSLNPQGIIEQQRLIHGSFFGFLARVSTGYPFMTMRYVDLMVFAKEYFPSQYARFVAANPGIPEDLPRLATDSGSSARVLDENTKIQSGIAAGWATSGITLGALLLLVFLGSRDGNSYEDPYTDPYASPYADPYASAAPTAEPAVEPAMADAVAPAQADPVVAEEPPVVTEVAMDPDHPIVFDDFYPEISKQLGEQGECTVLMTVLADGSISEASIETTSGYPRLDQACLESVRDQHLLPATENGVPVARLVRLPIEWTLPTQ